MQFCRINDPRGGKRSWTHQPIERLHDGTLQSDRRTIWPLINRRIEQQTSHRW
jgi:hypothetical protein